MKKSKGKLIALIAAFSLLLAAVPVMSAAAWVGDRYADPDYGFQQFLQEVKAEGRYDYEEATWSKENLYNTAGEVSGLLYEFNFDNQTDGYLFMAKLENSAGTVFYETTELYFGGTSPYTGFSGTKLYPTFMVYLVEQEDGTYLDVLNDIEVTLEGVQIWERQGFGFGGSSDEWDLTENYYYDHKTDVAAGMPDAMPAWALGSTLGSNGCAIMAGSNIIGAWDRYKTNLIPNYDPGTYYYGYYFWKGESSTISTVVDELYVDMETNSTGAGTTIAQFKSGLKKYAQRHGGYSVSYSSVMSGSTYNLTAMENAFAAEKPVALFLHPYYNFIGITGIVKKDGYDFIVAGGYSGAHTMVACGTRYINYYNSSNVLTRSDKYLRVAGCRVECTEGYIRITDTYFSLNDAFSITIS